MASEERLQLLFDMDFAKIAAQASGEGIAVEPGAPVALINEFGEISVIADNVMQIPKNLPFTDPYYPVIDVATKKIVGCFFTKEKKWLVYRRESVMRKGGSVIFGRYLMFMPHWSVVHTSAIRHYDMPAAVLLLPN